MTDDLQACAPCLCAQEGADRAAISSCHWRSRELFVIKWMTKRCKRPNSSQSPASREAWPGQGLTWSLHLKQETFNVAAKTSEQGMHSIEATAPDGQGLKTVSNPRLWQFAFPLEYAGEHFSVHQNIYRRNKVLLQKSTRQWPPVPVGKDSLC